MQYNFLCVNMVLRGAEKSKLSVDLSVLGLISTFISIYATYFRNMKLETT